MYTDRRMYIYIYNAPWNSSISNVVLSTLKRTRFALQKEPFWLAKRVLLRAKRATFVLRMDFCSLAVYLSLYSTFTTTTRIFWSALSVLIFAICQSPGKNMKNLSGVESTKRVLSTS